jgi:hypothetical protein
MDGNCISVTPAPHFSDALLRHSSIGVAKPHLLRSSPCQSAATWPIKCGISTSRFSWVTRREQLITLSSSFSRKQLCFFYHITLFIGNLNINTENMAPTTLTQEVTKRAVELMSRELVKRRTCYRYRNGYVHAFSLLSLVSHNRTLMISKQLPSNIPLQQRLVHNRSLDPHRCPPLRCSDCPRSLPLSRCSSQEARPSHDYQQPYDVQCATADYLCQ